MIKVKQKDVMDSYYNVISIGYCDLQYLLKCKDYKMYTCGVYGWNASIYHINNNTCLVTGYRPFGNIQPKHEVIRKYEEKAREISKDYNLSWKEQSKKLEKLLNKFVERVVNNA